MNARIAVTHQLLGSVVLAAAAIGATVASISRSRPAPPAIVPTPAEIEPIADVSEPPPACDPRLLGTWIAQTFRTEFSDYHQYTLTVGCRDGELTAALDLAVFRSDCAKGESPPRYRIAATIAATTDTIHVDAGAVLSIAAGCSSGGGYSRDHFVGAYDAARGALVLYNNDEAGYAHGRLYDFHRALVDVSQ